MKTLLETIRTPRDIRGFTIPQLEQLAREMRQAICAQVMQSGGHLAPNLGVVELSIALHYVFDFGFDRLLFDVGHQCYPHKLLTGRLGVLEKLRTREGMAGFPEPRESEYDLFSVGHAGTAISTAVGMARGDVLNKDSFDPKSNPGGRRVVTLIGGLTLGPRERIAVIESQGRRWMIGVTGQSISLLAELDRPDAAAPSATPPAASGTPPAGFPPNPFAQMLDRLKRHG
jgi:hypothetical protein